MKSYPKVEAVMQVNICSTIPFQKGSRHFHGLCICILGHVFTFMRLTARLSICQARPVHLMACLCVRYLSAAQLSTVQVRSGRLIIIRKYSATAFTLRCTVHCPAKLRQNKPSLNPAGMSCLVPPPWKLQKESFPCSKPLLWL